MSDRRLIPLQDPDDVPPNMTEQEARQFWSTHEVTEEYLRRAGSVAEVELPDSDDGSRTISLRIDVDTFRRIKTLAKKKRTTPRDVLAEALVQWLPAAEEREGLARSG